MRWIVVAIVAEVLVAVALAAAISFATSSTTCTTNFEYSGGRLPSLFEVDRFNYLKGVPPSSTEQTCERSFWWD